MTLQQITASDIASWDSLQDIADSFEKRGLTPRPNLGDDHELVLQLDDDEFVTIVEGGPGESATDFKPENRTRHTNLVATNDYENFTFITRVRSWEGQQHGRIKHQKLSFSKEQFQRESGEKNTILQKLNSIEYGSSAAIYDTLYDTRQVVKEFYQQFESLRTDLVQEVSGIPDDRGDAKQRYVQVLLDRMIFLYFIQEKRLLDRNLDYLHEQPAKVVDEGDDRFEEFYEPLFFDYLAEDKQNPEFGKLPYLNGGLFAKNPIEEEFEDAKLGDSPEKTNELFDKILDFLSDWNWNVDERLDIVDPKNLSPAVLGHIFEQTVNQKEMGAYYTPEEITGFMARQTLHPYILEQVNKSVDASYDEIDDIFGFVDTEVSGGTAALVDRESVTQQAPTENVAAGHVETLYHDILKETKLLDPAVGSGAFLLAAQEVLLDIYMQCIEFFQRLESEGKGWELESRTRDELEAIESGEGSRSLYAKRDIILNNLYGVDIDNGAVEICKLRLWLSMVADIEDEPGEVEPLPNIDFNIRQGNSLIGFTEVQEVVNERGDTSLSNYGGGVGESIQEMYGDIISAVERHREADSTEEATDTRNLAESYISEYSQNLDEKVLKQFHDAGIEDITIKELKDYSPFHWVLEFATVYRDCGFDIVIGNPPWDRLKPQRDDYFSKFDEVFRSRMPEDKDRKQEELLKNEEIEIGWEEYNKEMDNRAKFYNKSESYTLQRPKIGGRTQATDNDLSALFFERVFNLVADAGYVSQILPGTIFNGASGKNLRMYLLEENSVESLMTFENRGIFENLHYQYSFGIVTFRRGGSTDNLRGIFQQTDLSILRQWENMTFEIPKKVLTDYSPEARIFPYLDTKQEVEVLKSILDHPRLSEEIDNKWYVEVTSELDRNLDTERFFENKQDYPIIGGKNIYQFCYDNQIFDDIDDIVFWSVENDTERSGKWRLKEKEYRRLKRHIYNQLDGSGSQKSFVNNLLEEKRDEPLSEEDVLLDSSEYRVVFRKIARSSDERTMIASVVPPDRITEYSLQSVRYYQIEVSEDDLTESPLRDIYKPIFSSEEMFVFIGLANSIPFDFLMRTKIDSNIPKYKLEESQMPRLTKGDNWFNYIFKRSARLNCYGNEFSEMRERLEDVEPAKDKEVRRQLQGEIDAAAFLAYGLDSNEVEFILNNFHRVSNPRVVNNEYLDEVFKKYRHLDEKGPYK